MLKAAVIGAVIISLLGIGAYIYLTKDLMDDNNLIVSTAKEYRGRDGVLHDKLNQLGVTDENDVTYKIVDDKIVVYYGKVTFKFDLNNLTPEVKDSMRLFSLDIQKSPDGQILVLYKGKIVKKVV